MPDVTVTLTPEQRDWLRQVVADRLVLVEAIATLGAIAAGKNVKKAQAANPGVRKLRAMKKALS